jgi:hypothetical protein
MIDESDQGELSVANGQKAKICGVGVVEETLILPNGETKLLKIDNVLFVPTMSKNLMSIPQINKANKLLPASMGILCM